MMLFGEADTRLRDGETAAAAPRPDATFEERWSAAVDAQLKAYNLNSEWSTKEAAFDASIDGLFALTGQRLENPYRDRGLALDMSPEAIERRTGTNPVTLFESEVQRLAGQMPDKAGEILKFGRVLDRARETRNTAVRRLEDVTARSPFAPNVPLFGPVDPVALAGSLWGSLGDPATLAVNALGAAGKGGTLLYHFARSALINAGAEVVQQPFIKQWANEAGDPYGWDDAARSVAAAALLGGALDTSVRGGYRGVQRARGLEPVREGTLITGWRSPEEKAAALDAAAARLPEDNPVRRAAEGDVAAVREIAEATGTIEDPALRGAILAREMSDGLDAPPAMALDGGDGYAALAQALRSATDPDEPPPAVLASLPPSSPLKAALDEIEIRTPEVRAIEEHLAAATRTYSEFPRALRYVVRNNRYERDLVLADLRSRLAAAERENQAWPSNRIAVQELRSAIDAARVPGVLEAGKAESELSLRLRSEERTAGTRENRIGSVGEFALWRRLEKHNHQVKYTLRTPSGEQIASAMMNPAERYVGLVDVAERYRRQGIASQLYDAIESDVGARLIPSQELISEASFGLWLKRDPVALYRELPLRDHRRSPVEAELRRRGIDPQQINNREPASLPREQRRAAAAETLVRTDQTAAHEAILGVRAEERLAPAGRLDDVAVAGAEAKAQTAALERDLARSTEHAAKPALRAERAAKLSQIKREPATRAKSTSDSLRTTSIDVPQDLFRWLGVEPARFQADYDFIARKRAEKPSPGADLSDPAAVRTFVEDVLTRASIALRTSEKHAANTWDLIARNGADKVVGVRLELKAGRYNVRTALAYEAGQLERRLAASLKEHGDDAVRWRDPEAASEILALMRRDSALAKDLSAQKLMTALARSQDGLADLAIAEGRYVHAHAATERMAEIRAEIDRTVKMLPKDVRLRVVDTLRFGEREANGAWDGYDRIVYVSLAAADPVRAVRHETVHALRQSGLMTDQEFDTLYRFAEGAGLRQAYRIDANYGDLYRKAYADRGDAGVEALLREETIADLFADYSLNGRRFADEFGRAGRTVDKVLDAIVKFLKQVRDALHIQGFRDVRDIFEAIESGAMAGRAERVTLPGGGEIEGFHLFALKAFHGTPHTFDPEPGAPAGRFRADRIGTGEGAQVFGHGLYFAESEGVAKWYREKLSRHAGHGPGDSATFIDGRMIELDEVAAFGHYRRNGRSFERAIEAVEKMLAQHKSELRSASLTAITAKRRQWRDTLRSLGDGYEKTLQILTEWKERGAVITDEPPPQGALYEVRIDAEPDQFLDWDKPLSQQSEAVKKSVLPVAMKEAERELQRRARNHARNDAQIREVFGKEPPPREPLPTAEELAMRLWGNELARGNEDALREAGLVGVRYLDQSSRANGEGTSNFVIFPGNEHLVEIVAVDGKPVVNLAGDLAGVERTTDLQHLAEACKL